MLKILKYSFYDIARSRWTIFYCLFYLLLTLSLFWLSPDLSKVIISLMNVILILVPLIATIFGVMYYYNSREFVELLLAQPINRKTIFLGQYIGVALSLAASLLIGVGLPFLLYGIIGSSEIWNYFILLLTGTFLSFIFSAISFAIALHFEDRIKGFSLAIFVWLLFAVVYDGIFLLLLASFSDYPLDKFAFGASVFNPIDLSRILILLKLDVSALMGYTGAIFKNYLGTTIGMLGAFAVLTAWIFLPMQLIQGIAKRKDF